MKSNTPFLRIGIGYDVHRLAEGRDLWLGGIRIDHPLGLEGHSDADVVLHALCDALLGALALGDIGQHFPNTDPRYAGIDSKALLRHCRQLVEAEGYTVLNVDASVVAEAPKLAPHIPAMRQAIAQELQCNLSAVSIKATTNEGLGFAGRAEGIAAWAVALLQHNPASDVA
jgi:2-C-methyl-D-erythritol 2,4-cyclodiphosphate synthase